MSKTLIYFGGDSFIEGDEITDMFLDGFPGWKDYEILHPDPEGGVTIPPELTEWSEATWDQDTLNGFIKAKGSKLLPGKVDLAREVRNSLSVSGEIRSQVDCDVYCNARAGASMDAINRRTVTDLLRFKSKYDRILAFVGTTSTVRRSIPPTRLEDYGNGSEHICFIPLYNRGNEDVRKLQDYFIKYSTDYHDIINFFMNAINIKNFCAQNDIELHWINSLNNFNLYHNIIKHRYRSSDYLKRYYDHGASKKEIAQIEEKYKLLSENTDYDVLKAELNYQELVHLRKLAKEVGKGVYAPEGHYSPEFHKVLASKLMPIITQGNYAKQVSPNYDYRDDLVDRYVKNLNKWREVYHEQNPT